MILKDKKRLFDLIEENKIKKNSYISIQKDKIDIFTNVLYVYYKQQLLFSLGRYPKTNKTDQMYLFLPTRFNFYYDDFNYHQEDILTVKQAIKLIKQESLKNYRIEKINYLYEKN